MCVCMICIMCVCVSDFVHVCVLYMNGFITELMGF